MNIHDIYLDI